MCMPSLRSQDMVPDALGLELQMFISYSVDSGK